MGVINCIQDAFAGIKLGSSHSIRQCIAIDNYMPIDDPEFAEYKDFKNWKDIPDEQIEKIGTHGVFVYTGNEGIVFHLPAAMIYCVKNYKGFFSSPPGVNEVYDRTLTCLQQTETINLLTKKQVCAATEFLRYIIENNTDDTDVEKEKSLYERLKLTTGSTTDRD